MRTVLDTSAVAAVVFGEPDAEALLSIMMVRSGDLIISAATMVELAIVVQARQGLEARADLQVLIDRLGVETVPFDGAQTQAAVHAWHRFGKGRHSAGLNLGDCFAYALAKVSGACLLFKGEDFAQTDIASAI